MNPPQTIVHIIVIIENRILMVSFLSLILPQIWLSILNVDSFIFRNILPTNWTHSLAKLDNIIKTFGMKLMTTFKDVGFLSWVIFKANWTSCFIVSNLLVHCCSFLLFDFWELSSTCTIWSTLWHTAFYDTDNSDDNDHNEYYCSKCWSAWNLKILIQGFFDKKSRCYCCLSILWGF